MLFVNPSPSQSAACQTGFAVLGVEPAVYTHGSKGSVSVPLGVPSPSQSAANHAALGALVTLEEL